VSPYYNWLDPDAAAAFPSLHAAFPLLSALALWPVTRRGSAVAFVWSATVWFSVVYLGQHYVTDVIGGIVFAVGTWAVMTQVVVPLVPALQHRAVGSGESGSSEPGSSGQNSAAPGTAEQGGVETLGPTSTRGAG
jgi:hypothetical protein